MFKNRIKHKISIASEVKKIDESERNMLSSQFITNNNDHLFVRYILQRNVNMN